MVHQTAGLIGWIERQFPQAQADVVEQAAKVAFQAG